jgi:hypothetical protein
VESTRLSRSLAGSWLLVGALEQEEVCQVCLVAVVACSRVSESALGCGVSMSIQPRGSS